MEPVTGGAIYLDHACAQTTQDQGLEPYLTNLRNPDEESGSSKSALNNKLDDNDSSEEGQTSVTLHQLDFEVSLENEPVLLKGEKVRKIACMGAGFVGGPTSAVIAFMSDIEITVVDVDKERIVAWNSDNLPFFEPGLCEIVAATRDGKRDSTSLRHRRSDEGKMRPVPTRDKSRQPNLFFSADILQAIEDADMIIICVNTPMNLKADRTGSTTNLDFIEAAARMIAKAAKSDKIVVEKSTVPHKTADLIREILSNDAVPGVSFEVLSNPEFLAAGTAVRDLMYPDRVIIGSTSTSNGLEAARKLAEVYSWVPQERIVKMDLWSAELSKLAANALLAQRVSSVNALSAICEATGIDVKEVSYACGLDPRIGHSMLKAGPGFGGSCFQKDLSNLVYLSESLRLFEVANYWQAVININEFQKNRFTSRIISCMHHNLAGKKIAVLGFAFKKDTSDTRESPAILLTSKLMSEGAQLAIYDPRVKEMQIWDELVTCVGDESHVKSHVEISKSAYQACASSSAVVIMTNWDEFSNKMEPHKPKVFSIGKTTSNQKLQQVHQMPAENQTPMSMPPLENIEISLIPTQETCLRLNWGRIASGMRKPRYIFDAHNMLDAKKLEALDCHVETIGKAHGSQERGLCGSRSS